MNITNPTNFGIPGLTLTTANAEGTGNAIRTGASILAFDATDPAAVAASAVVGSATVSARRDHVHAGTTATGSVVDEAITRFDGTGGASLQGYSSLSPTISNAGIINLTSGALKFPATEIVSADANTMDDWQQGSWTPALSDTTTAVSKGQSYNTQSGTYTKVGDRVLISGHLDVADIGTLSGGAHIIGLPFTSKSGVTPSTFSVSKAKSLGLGTAGFNLGAETPANTAYLSLQVWDAAAGTTDLTCAEYSDGGEVEFGGQYQTT